jgi:hypothetical protein
MKGILRVGTPKPKPQSAPAPAPAASPLKLVKIGDFELPTDVDASIPRRAEIPLLRLRTSTPTQVMRARSPAVSSSATLGFPS